MFLLCGLTNLAYMEKNYMFLVPFYTIFNQWYTLPYKLMYCYLIL